MNHSEFRQWVKNLSDEQIKEVGLKTPSSVIAVCLILALYGEYATGTKIEVAWSTIAKQARVSRTTAHKVRDWLLRVGVLERTGKTERNISIYRFRAVIQPKWTTEVHGAAEQLSTEDGQLTEIGDGDQLSIPTKQLSIQRVQLSIADKQLSIVGGHNSTLDSTKDSIHSKDDPSPVSNEPADRTTSLNSEPKGVDQVPACPVQKEVSTSLSLKSKNTLINLKWSNLYEDEQRVFKQTKATPKQIEAAVKAYKRPPAKHQRYSAILDALAEFGYESEEW